MKKVSPPFSTLWYLVRMHQGLESALALAVFTGLIGSFIDGLADPSLRGPSVYLAFWLCIALSVILPRIGNEQAAEVRLH